MSGEEVSSDQALTHVFEAVTVLGNGFADYKTLTVLGSSQVAKSCLKLNEGRPVSLVYTKRLKRQPGCQYVSVILSVSRSHIR